MSRRVACVVVVLLLAAVSACSSSASTGSRTSTVTFNKATAHYRSLVRAADLASCPTSSTTPTATTGGLPSLTLECLGSGPPVHLGGLAGKPAVVNIWASWCGPCQQEAGFLSKAYDADRGKVAFLGIDTEDDWDSALDIGTHVTPPVRYPSVYDEDRKAMIALHVSGPPYTALVSSTGQIVYATHGPITSFAQLQQEITTYLHVAT